MITGPSGDRTHPAARLTLQPLRAESTRMPIRPGPAVAAPATTASGRGPTTLRRTPQSHKAGIAQASGRSQLSSRWQPRMVMGIGGGQTQTWGPLSSLPRAGLGPGWGGTRGGVDMAPCLLHHRSGTNEGRSRGHIGVGAASTATRRSAHQVVVVAASHHPHIHHPPPTTSHLPTILLRHQLSPLSLPQATPSRVYVRRIAIVWPWGEVRPPIGVM